MKAHMTTIETRHSPLALRKSLMWRIHFWAALIASPFTLVATLTGIFYIFTPQIEAVLYAQLDHVRVGATLRPLDDAVAAAQAAVPAGYVLQSVLPAYAPGNTVKVYFKPPRPVSGPAHHAAASMPMDMPMDMPMPAAKPMPMPAPAAATGSRPFFVAPAKALVVYVNPYTAAVAGTLAEQDRFNAWARKLHSGLLQGDGWRWMIELAASWLMVMLLTGIYLWWPRGRQAVLPRAGLTGRQGWKEWHAFLGVALGLLTFILVSTGLTWSRHAGAQVGLLRDWTHQGSPHLPATLMSMAPAGTPRLSWQAALEATRRQAPDTALQLTPPHGAMGYWRTGAAERSHPTRGFDMALDAYTGRRLYYVGWDAQTAFGKFTAVGIPFHRGELGWWNQALLLVFALGVLFSLLSGWVMYWKRRKPGTLGLPRLLPGAWRGASPAFWVLGALLFALMPLLALTGGVLLVLEWLLLRPWQRAA